MASGVSQDKEKLGRELKSLALSAKGVSLHTLEKDYRDVNGKSIPFRDYGCHSLQHLIENLGNYVHMRGDTVYATSTANSRHLEDLISRTRSKSKGRAKSAASLHRTIVPSRRGRSVGRPIAGGAPLPSFRSTFVRQAPAVPAATNRPSLGFGSLRAALPTPSIRMQPLTAPAATADEQNTMKRQVVELLEILGAGERKVDFEQLKITYFSRYGIATPGQTFPEGAEAMFKRHLHDQVEVTAGPKRGQLLLSLKKQTAESGKQQRPAGGGQPPKFVTLSASESRSVVLDAAGLPSVTVPGSTVHNISNGQMMADRQKTFSDLAVTVSNSSDMRSVQDLNASSNVVSSPVVEMSFAQSSDRQKQFREICRQIVTESADGVSPSELARRFRQVSGSSIESYGLMKKDLVKALRDQLGPLITVSLSRSHGLLFSPATNTAALSPTNEIAENASGLNYEAALQPRTKLSDLDGAEGSKQNQQWLQPIEKSDTEIFDEVRARIRETNGVGIPIDDVQTLLRKRFCDALHFVAVEHKDNFSLRFEQAVDTLKGEVPQLMVCESIDEAPTTVEVNDPNRLASLTVEIPVQKLPNIDRLDEMPQEDEFDIRFCLVSVAHFESPSDFYLHSCADDLQIQLMNLENEMLEYYDNHEIELLGSKAERGVTCVCFLGAKFHRCRVLDVDFDQAQVFLIDRGSTVVVEVCCLGPLLERFCLLPAQAIPAAFNDVVPFIGDAFDVATIKAVCQQIVNSSVDGELWTYIDRIEQGRILVDLCFKSPDADDVIFIETLQEAALLRSTKVCSNGEPSDDGDVSQLEKELAEVLGQDEGDDDVVFVEIAQKRLTDPAGGRELAGDMFKITTLLAKRTREELAIAVEVDQQREAQAQLRIYERRLHKLERMLIADEPHTTTFDRDSTPQPFVV